MIQYTNRIKNHGEVLVLEKLYLIRKKEYRTPDIMVFGRDYAILIEASATRLQAKRTTSLGIPEAFEEDCEKMIFHNVKSLDTFINNFIDNKISFEGIETGAITHIFPIVVTIEGFPQHRIIDAFLEAEIKERRLLNQEPVRGLSILDIQDIEFLEAFCKEHFINVLRGWHGNSSELIPRVSWYEYTTTSIETSNEVLSHWSDDFVRNAFDEAISELLGNHIENQKD